MRGAATDPRIQPYRGVVPTLGEGVFVADSARVIGDVHLGAGTSIWYGTVVRGDVHFIRIGKRVNLQDLTVVHVTTARHATHIEDDVSAGHRAVIHGATVRAGALIGMGAIVMDGAEIGEQAIVGAGALVTPGTRIPARMLALGSPAKPVRELTPDELAMLARTAAHYVELGAEYRAAEVAR
jgi:carbonic anhydrase/acetyltransferase-like protein (isoleucine patch superfamily)